MSRIHGGYALELVVEGDARSRDGPGCLHAFQVRLEGLQNHVEIPKMATAWNLNGISPLSSEATFPGHFFFCKICGIWILLNRGFQSMLNMVLVSVL